MSRLEQVTVHVFDYKIIQEKLQSIKSKNKLLSKYDYVQLSSLQISELINEKMVSVVAKIILPILGSFRIRIPTIFNNKLPQFVEYCLELEHLNYMLSPTEKHTFEKDKEILENARVRIDHISWLDESNKQDSLDIIDVLIRHFQKIDILTKYKQSELEDALFIIDFENLKLSLFGTLLGFVCIMIAIHPVGKRLVSRKKYKPLVNMGLQFARNLDKYNDELMILTKSDNFDLISNSNLVNTDPFDKVNKIQLSVSELNNLLVRFQKYEKGEINTDDFHSTLNLLKNHFKIRYNVDSQSNDIFEDLATMIKQILHEKHTKNESPDSPNLRVIELILALKEITPLKVSIAESLPAILHLNSEQY